MIGTASRRTAWRSFVPDTPTPFARKLTELREAKGLSKYRLAELAGLTHQAMSLLESGQREPNWQTVQRLALALGVDCTAFTDPELQLPEAKPPKKPGPKPKVPEGKKPKGK
jgi:transcriptional regulator with XRE-family HTH domain